MSLTPRAVKVTPIKDTMKHQIGSIDHLCAHIWQQRQEPPGSVWDFNITPGRGSHQLQKAGGSGERQEKAAQRHMNIGHIPYSK